jgi:hypothetical protein
MATQSTQTGPEFFAGAQSPEDVRRRFIEAPLEAAQQSVLSSGLEVANLLSILPDAFLASQRRELERLKQSGKEKDSRIEFLQTSIEQTGVFRTTAQRAQARAGRALAALADTDTVFHGFVSNAELTPLAGLTVRLIGDKGTSAESLSAATEEDGYFRIVLHAKSNTRGGAEAKARPPNLSQRIVDVMSGLSQQTSASTAASAEAGGSRVEILKKGTVIHSDPVPLLRDNGSVYREYVIVDAASAAASGLRDSMSDRSNEASSSRSGPKREDAEPSPPDADEPPSPPESSAPPTVAGKAQRVEKSTKLRRKE